MNHLWPLISILSAQVGNLWQQFNILWPQMGILLAFCLHKLAFCKHKLVFSGHNFVAGSEDTKIPFCGHKNKFLHTKY